MLRPAPAPALYGFNTRNPDFSGALVHPEFSHDRTIFCDNHTRYHITAEIVIDMLYQLGFMTDQRMMILSVSRRSLPPGWTQGGLE